MLDTIKLGVPLTPTQHKRILAIAEGKDGWQWVLLNQTSGELLFRRVSGQARTDGESFHRQLRWDIPHEYIKNECQLTLEFSVPKFWYGHNIHLLYDFIAPLNRLRELLNQQFGLKGRGQLTNIDFWKVLRADFCYAWKFPSQRLAQQFLNSLKRLHFPRKKPIIYDDSILFTGKTYSVKIYLKLPEFKKHDRKEMLKGNAALEWVNHCESMAEGVLRFEVTCRRQFLKRQNIQTVADLSRPIRYTEWIEGKQPEDKIERNFCTVLALYQHFKSDISLKTIDLKEKEVFDSGLTLPYALDILDQPISGSIAFHKRDNPTAIMQFLLIRFVGENAGMQRADEVESKLLETYKPVKAARLVSFWLYVQKFGSAKTKEIFGDRSYYYTKSELKKAGITLIEPPSGNNITILDRDFMSQFKPEIPSQFVTNQFDDFRESGNLLNFPIRESNSDAS